MTRAGLGGYASKSNKRPRVEQGQSQQGDELLTVADELDIPPR